ncbi:sortase domain-containing protein [Tessaracoccus palaemonis]|uniref:Sortase n=1 Tax=Tessaracoccus palaemonis TaxID=2829499 RepID=A0ABX8SJ03_9ACTN|nr:sortase [Tessaracoccus palaemonis]QXT63290.1 sortase [Tessaracoccus palaemonis]
MQAKKKTGKRGTSPLAVFLIALVIAALSLGGWIAWSYWGSNVLAQRAAADELAGVQTAIAEATPTAIETDGAPEVAHPAIGTAAWIVRIPAIGLEAPVIAGVEPSDLNRGLGWYPGTSLPGQAGNFALAGNRVTGGAFLRDVMSLAVGDQVIIETPEATFTYTLTVAPADLTVASDDSWVLDPVPGHVDVVPTQAFLTLTTAEDLVPTGDRSVGFGTLTKTETP